MLDKELITELIKYDGGKFKVSSINDAYAFCEKITKMHYENFPVASFLLPSNKRNYIYPIYAFARIADDVADEIADSENKIQILDKLQENIFNHQTNHPIFLALQDTITKINLDANLLSDLIKAFKIDSEFQILNNTDEILNYCKYSANPIGRIMLRIFEEDTEQNCIYSDKICTALQLTNFWQDISRDLRNNRIYFPKDKLTKYNLFEKDLLKLQYKNELNDLIIELINETEKIFHEGKLLINSVKSKRLRFELKLTVLGGLRVLSLCKNLKGNLIHQRPRIRKIDYLLLFINALKWK
jgi:squalene synthase HpnC